MQDIEVNVFIQSLRGHQSTIVLAYLLLRRALTIDELAICTGLNDDTVRSAVKGLAGKGLLFVQRGERGKQIWLPSGDTFFGRLLGQNPKISEPGSSSSSSFEDSSYLPQEQEEQADSENFGICLAACDEFGIREPKRSKISRLKHVTPELIRAHVMQVRDDNLPLGTAIHRIEFNWMPEAKYLEPQKTVKGYWNRYFDFGGESEEE